MSIPAAIHCVTRSASASKHPVAKRVEPRMNTDMA